MVRWLLTLHMETDGSSTSGTFKIRNPVFYEEKDFIRIDKGLKFKIWGIRLIGEPLYLIVKYSDNVVDVETPTWTEIARIYLVSSGSLIHDKRRPIIVIEGRTGKEGVAFDWSQAEAKKSYVGLEVEFSDEEVE